MFRCQTREDQNRNVCFQPFLFFYFKANNRPLLKQGFFHKFIFASVLIHQEPLAFCCYSDVIECGKPVLLFSEKFSKLHFLSVSVSQDHDQQSGLIGRVLLAHSAVSLLRCVVSCIPTWGSRYVLTYHITLFISTLFLCAPLQFNVSGRNLFPPSMSSGFIPAFRRSSFICSSPLHCRRFIFFVSLLLYIIERWLYKTRLRLAIASDSSSIFGYSYLVFAQRLHPIAYRFSDTIISQFPFIISLSWSNYFPTFGYI